MIIFKSLCSKCWRGNSKNFLYISSFFDPGLHAMKRNYKSVWMKGSGSQWVSEHACGLLGWNHNPLMPQGPRDTLSSAGSSPSAAAAIQPAATLVFPKRCFHGPGFPQAQLRPDLSSLLLDHLKVWSSRNSLDDGQQTVARKGCWPFLEDLAAHDFVTLSIGPGHFACLPDISLFYIPSTETKNPWEDHFSHPDICVVPLYS